MGGLWGDSIKGCSLAIGPAPCERDPTEPLTPPAMGGKREGAFPGPWASGPWGGETRVSVVVLWQLDAPRPWPVAVSVHCLCCYQTNWSGKFPQRTGFTATQPPAASTPHLGQGRAPGGLRTGGCCPSAWSSSICTETGRGCGLVTAPRAPRRLEPVARDPESGPCALWGQPHEEWSSDYLC